MHRKKMKNWRKGNDCLNPINFRGKNKTGFFFPLTNWNHFNDTSALINSRSKYKGKVSHQTLKIKFLLFYQAKLLNV